MNYIYTLSANGIVFYVGCSKMPITRFSNHITGKDKSTTHIINTHFKNKVSVELCIVGHNEDRALALITEKSFIEKYAGMGYILANYSHNSKAYKKDGSIKSIYFKRSYDKQPKAALLKYINKHINKGNKKATWILWNGTYGS